VKNLYSHFQGMKPSRILEVSFDTVIFTLQWSCKQCLRRAFKRTSQRSK